MLIGSGTSKLKNKTLNRNNSELNIQQISSQNNQEMSHDRSNSLIRKQFIATESKIKSRIEADKKIYSLMKNKRSTPENTPEKNYLNTVSINSENDLIQSYGNMKYTNYNNNGYNIKPETSFRAVNTNTSFNNKYLSDNNSLILKNDINLNTSNMNISNSIQYHEKSYRNEKLNESTASQKGFYIEFDKQFQPQTIKEKAMNSLQDGYMNSKLKDSYKNQSFSNNEEENKQKIIKDFENQYKDLDSRGNKVREYNVNKNNSGGYITTSERENSQMLSPHFNTNNKQNLINYEANSIQNQYKESNRITAYENEESCRGKLKLM
jgi:hypothetical protein